jgi:predicted permease
MVALILIGALLKWAKILRPEYVPFINSLVVNLTLPMTVFTSVLGLRSVPQAEWLNLLRIPLIAYAVSLVCGVLAYFLSRLLRLERRTAGAFIILAMLSATAFVGYPLRDALYRPMAGEGLPANCTACRGDEVCQIYAEAHPEECASYDRANAAAVFYSELGTLIPIVTVAVVVASRYGEGEKFTWRSLLAMLKFAPFVAFLLGLLFFNENIPPVITGVVGLLAQLTTPLIMLSLGITIRWDSILSRKSRGAMLALNVLKLAVAPAVAFLLASLLGIGGESLQITVMMAGLPSLILCLSLAHQYHLDVEFASNALFSTFIVGAGSLYVLLKLLGR